MPSPERATAEALISAFNTLDIDRIISLRTPTCTRTFLPSSLSLPTQSNSTYRANLLSMKSVFTSFHISITDLIEGTDSAGNKKIVMYVSARGDTAVGEYRNEYVWKMGFEEEGGGKICEWSEYVDVGVVREFYPKLREEVGRRMREREARGERLEEQ